MNIGLFTVPDNTRVTDESYSYTALFGSGTRVAGRLELGPGRETLTGLWAVTLGVGYWRAIGTAQDLDASLNPADSTISLTLIPLMVCAVWRGDFLQWTVGLPFVPYVRLGYGFVPWSSGRVSGNGASESGWAFGFEYGAGIHLVLDAFDANKGAEVLRDVGLRSTSLFAGYRGQSWDTPGGPSLAGNGFETGIEVAF